MLTTHNQILEAQITDQATSSPTPLGKLPIKLKPNPREQCNYVTMKWELDDSKGMELKESGDANRAMSEDKGDELEATTLGDENSLGV